MKFFYKKIYLFLGEILRGDRIVNTKFKVIEYEEKKQIYDILFFHLLG